MTVPHARRIRTLWLLGILHAFTHIYHVCVMPLYLQIQQGLGLPEVGKATLLMTVLMVSYFGPSYPMGLLADHFSRKKLLVIGLFINGLGFLGLGLSKNFSFAIASMIVAGLGGSLFHPAATAMVARLFPEATGRALGLFGIGASAGFFIGPLYSGWRGGMSGWRAPLIELGLAGMVFALLFYWLADEEAPGPAPQIHRPESRVRIFPNGSLWVFFIAACLAFGLRDFAGFSMGSLGSLFLQRAHGFDVRHTGFVLSFIYIASALSNPLFGGLSDKSRLRWCLLVLACAALLVTLFPHLPKGWMIPGFLAYGFFFMASYPIIEAAVMVSVPENVRGRVFGIWLTIGGFTGNLSHWLVGKWVQHLGPSAYRPEGFYWSYAFLGGLILLSLLGLPCLHAIRRREHLDDPKEAVVPPLIQPTPME